MNDPEQLAQAIERSILYAAAWDIELLRAAAARLRAVPDAEPCKTCNGEGFVMGVGDPTDGRPCPDCSDDKLVKEAKQQVFILSNAGSLPTLRTLIWNLATALDRHAHPPRAGLDAAKVLAVADEMLKRFGGSKLGNPEYCCMVSSDVAEGWINALRNAVAKP